MGAASEYSALSLPTGRHDIEYVLKLLSLWLALAFHLYLEQKFCSWYLEVCHGWVPS